jgi:hypothetical protein
MEEKKALDIPNTLQNVFGDVIRDLPRFLGAIALLIIAGIVANLVRSLVAKGTRRLSMPRHLDTEASNSLTKALSEIGFAITWLLFLPGIFGLLGVNGVLAPLQVMVVNIFGFLPNLLGAGIIFYVGNKIAQVLKSIVSSLLSTAGVDKLGERFGMDKMTGGQKLSNIGGTVVHALVLLPVLIAALQALKMDALTAPATAMLSKILTGIPNFFAAAATLGLSFIIGRILAGVVTSLLVGIGFDRLPAKIGLTVPSNTRKPSEIAGVLVIVGITTFAIIEASQLLGFTMLADLTKTLTLTAGQVLTGIIVLAIGMYVANIAAGLVKSSGVASASKLAIATRVVILGFVGAMALKQMGIASDIVNTAFGITLGAIGVAVALAFGLGGRDAAAQLTQEFLEKTRKENTEGKVNDSIVNSVFAVESASNLVK